LIEKEYKKIGIPLVSARDNYQNTPFDQIDFESVQAIYIGGGEPTIMSEFYDFLQKCISVGRTNFDLNIGTNGLKFSDKIIKLLDHFSNVCFSVSFDGYKKINDYVRWRSDFDTIVDNTHMLQNRGHKIGFQTVFSMYNLTRIHEIFEFYDREFPGCSSLVNFGAGPDHFEPDNHPCPDLVVESMKRCQQTKVYYANGRSLKSMVDLTLKQYSDPDYKVNVDHLRHFYEFNTKLDQSRGSKLVDYVPELEQGCKFYLPI
jgi:pyruvate-formate lyase-activating enzyme